MYTNVQCTPTYSNRIITYMPNITRPLEQSLFFSTEDMQNTRATWTLILHISTEGYQQRKECLLWRKPHCVSICINYNMYYIHNIQYIYAYIQGKIRDIKSITFTIYQRCVSNFSFSISSATSMYTRRTHGWDFFQASNISQFNRNSEICLSCRGGYELATSGFTVHNINEFTLRLYTQMLVTY